MSVYIAEFIGTAILILLGNGVVANVALNDTHGNNSGWVVITLAWGVAVFTAVFTVAEISGAHINPAVTLGLALAGSFSWSLVPGYIVAQVTGAALGTTLVYLMYKPHYDTTDDSDAIRSTFCTGPAISNRFSNFLSEALGTFVLVYGVFHIAGAEVGDQSASLGALDALPVALVVVAVGMSLGGTTGYAINPARDLGPRIMHALLPIRGKGSSEWTYSWIPILGPATGAGIAALIFVFVG
jgi:glycerol uptake facilitator protein